MRRPSCPGCARGAPNCRWWRWRCHPPSRRWCTSKPAAGNGDRAFEYYNQINPVTKNDKIDEFECEPYVYPQNVLGDEHPQFGLARNSWLTGAASWAYQAATQHILGIAPTHNGLHIDPCIPTAWDGFNLVRRFRGAVYQIEVKNPDHVSRGVRSVKVDGQPIPGNLVPVLDGGKVHQVEVLMG